MIFFFNSSYQFFIDIYIKMSENLSAKHYQENKERLQKKLMKDIKIFLMHLLTHTKKRRKGTIFSSTLQKFFRR